MGEYKYFKQGMESLGFDVDRSETHIIPAILKDERLTQKFEEKLLTQKVFTHAITFPEVVRGMARLRVQISATHSQQDLKFALDTFEKVRDKIGVLE